MTRRATKPTITATQRAALLKQARAGYPLPVAASKADVELVAVRRAGAKLQREIVEAQEYAQAHLDSLLLEKGLAGDAACLRLAIERRDGAAAVRATEPGGTMARDKLARLLDGMAGRMDDDREIARQAARHIALLLSRGGDPDAALAEARAIASEPAPVPRADPAPAQPTMPENYTWHPESARILRSDGTLCGHSLSDEGAIAIAIADAAGRTAETTEEHAR